MSAKYNSGLFADGDETGEAITFGQTGAQLDGLTSTGDVTIDKASAALKVDSDTGTSGLITYARNGVDNWKILTSGGSPNRLIIQALNKTTGAFVSNIFDLDSDLNTIALSGAASVAVPVPSGSGHALRWGSAANVVALTATGDVTMTGNSRRLKIGNGTFPGLELSDASNVRRGLLYLDTTANAVKFLTYDAAGGGLTTGIEISTTTGAVTVPAATAANNAAQVSAIASGTGQLQIGGIEMGDTGWRNITLESGWSSSMFQLRRTGNVCSIRWGGLNGTSQTGVTAYTFTTGFKAGASGNDPLRAVVFDLSLDAMRSYGSTSLLFTGGNSASVTTGYATLNYLTTDAWPSSLPGSAA
jgi:hypothetical protein